MILNEYDKLVLRNGCRPAWLSDKIPDTIEKPLSSFFDLSFKHCCDKHDDCYYFGGDFKAFHKCNKDFYKCMKKIINNFHFEKFEKTKWYQIKWGNVKKGFRNVLRVPKITYLKFKAWEYYKLVEKFGEDSFHFGNGTDRLLPSYNPIKSKKIDEPVKWIFDRWWTVKEIKNITKGYK